MEQDLLLQWLLFCPILHKYINPLISKFIIIARLHLKGLRELNNIERNFIGLLMYNVSEITNEENLFSKKSFFSENNLIELYKKKMFVSQNGAEINNDEEKLLDFLLEYYDLRDNGEIYELLQMFDENQDM